VPDYCKLEELEFLKRGFNEVQGWNMGPLLTNSIVKAITWTRRDRETYRVGPQHVPTCGGTWPVAMNKELIATAINAMWPEMALHGQEAYYTMVREVISSSAGTNVDLKPPRWAEACGMMGYTVLEE